MTTTISWIAGTAVRVRLTSWVASQGRCHSVTIIRRWSSGVQCGARHGLWTSLGRRSALRTGGKEVKPRSWLILCSQRLHLQAGAAVIPHRDKRDRGGEDAFFITKRAAGVFDGVGGWSALGIDPGLYSRRLAELVRAGTESMDATSSLVSVLERAAQTNEAVGSCTACVVALSTLMEAAEPDKRRSVLTCVNLGDSGMMVLRKGKIIFRSKEQQHYFNCPYQLGTQSKDTPYDAFVDRIDVQVGDWLVLGTDGLFDNVFDEEIVDCIRDWCRERTERRAAAPDDPLSANAGTASPMASSLKTEADGRTAREMHSAADVDRAMTAPALLTAGAPALRELAERLARMAVTCAEDENRMSPFALNARSAGFWYYGGKLDDVTVIVGRVSRTTT
ncbi:hypothetical protein F1559_004850 [Cyanidiococcus yangmingshanensis]|uniref:Protein phosphatase n=1 Tax=Cyanidiococcus yangmingshanensis TaxID=2690220 RepID=A0A7J7IP48_9RHOD|nr:hypothetical protein F1559_004850 [Cyanidiococcus yangmingshanensis]